MNVRNHNVFERWPLEDKSVQAIITSPPYFGMRKYDIRDVVIGGREDCDHLWSEKGAPDPRTFDSSIVRHHKVNRDHAFCEYGKCHAFRGQHGLEPSIALYVRHAAIWMREAKRVLKDDGIMFINIADTHGERWMGADVVPKSLCLIPQRMQMELARDGWVLRDEIIWHKPNGIPESVKDRATKRYEKIIMATKKRRYYFDLDAIRVEYKKDSLRRFKGGYKQSDVPHEAIPNGKVAHKRTYNVHPLGANPGNIWAISASKGAGNGHYSVFPEELPARLIKCSTRPGDLVLDPFAGSGTTLLVAAKLGREAIGFDLGYEHSRKQKLEASA